MSMRMLLEHILINRNDFLDLEPWKPENKAKAVKACIEALESVDEDAGEDLIRVILHVCGGGKVEIEDGGRGRSIEVRIEKDGISTTLKSAELPQPLDVVQDELWILYQDSVSEKN